MRRVAAVLLLTLILIACSPGGPDEDATGVEIYGQLCARCHGRDLAGGVGPALGPGSNVATESDGYIEFTVRNGRGRMPSFPSLDDRQIDRLVAYIREAQER